MMSTPMDGRRTCTACRSAKVKCDRTAPVCGRCQRLQLPCVEQVRKQGRPTVYERSSGGAAGSKTPPSQNIPEAVLGDGGQQLVTDFILHSFQKMLHRNEVDVPHTLKLLRMMALQSLCWKRDFSCGLLDRLLQLLQFTLANLNDVVTNREECQAELDVIEVKLGGEGGVIEWGPIPSVLTPLDDRVSAIVCTINLNGAASHVICNQQFSDLFACASDFGAKMQNDGVAPPLVYANFFRYMAVYNSLVAAEDRLDFLEAMTKYYFGKNRDTELSQIVKMKDCFDTTFLAIVRLRLLTLAGGMYLATLISVSPAPSSKYIRGGNRDADNAVSWLGLNNAEARFRTRQPSPRLSDLGPEYRYSNLEDPQVKAYMQVPGAELDIAVGRAQAHDSAAAAAAAAAAGHGGGEMRPGGVAPLPLPGPPPPVAVAPVGGGLVRGGGPVSSANPAINSVLKAASPPGVDLDSAVGLMPSLLPLPALSSSVSAPVVEESPTNSNKSSVERNNGGAAATFPWSLPTLIIAGGGAEGEKGATPASGGATHKDLTGAATLIITAAQAATISPLASATAPPIDAAEDTKATIMDTSSVETTRHQHQHQKQGEAAATAAAAAAAAAATEKVAL